mgnify:CR=1 FL=1
MGISNTPVTTNENENIQVTVNNIYQATDFGEKCLPRFPKNLQTLEI